MNPSDSSGNGKQIQKESEGLRFLLDLSSNVPENSDGFIPILVQQQDTGSRWLVAIDILIQAGIKLSSQDSN